MAGRHDSGRPPLFGALDDGEHIDDPEALQNHQKARDTISIAISRLEARRAEGHVRGDRELVAQTSAEIARAQEVLRSLTPEDTENVLARHAEYMRIARSTPEVAPEILEQYSRMKERASGE